MATSNSLLRSAKAGKKPAAGTKRTSKVRDMSWPNPARKESQRREAEMPRHDGPIAKKIRRDQARKGTSYPIAGTFASRLAAHLTIQTAGGLFATSLTIDESSRAGAICSPRRTTPPQPSPKPVVAPSRLERGNFRKKIVTSTLDRRPSPNGKAELRGDDAAVTMLIHTGYQLRRGAIKGQTRFRQPRRTRSSTTAQKVLRRLPISGPIFEGLERRSEKA